MEFLYLALVLVALFDVYAYYRFQYARELAAECGKKKAFDKTSGFANTLRQDSKARNLSELSERVNAFHADLLELGDKLAQPHYSANVI